MTRRRWHRVRRSVFALVAAAICLAGCAAVPASPTSTSSIASPIPVATGAPPSASAAPSLAADAPAWLSEPLTDVRTGQPVRLGELIGHVVFVEGMATWCPPCLEQQREAASALRQLPGGVVVYVSVDIDPREPATTLRDYVDRNGFGWQFVLATPAFLRELSETFGATILSPPATPIVVIDMTGHATFAEVGIKRASRLVELARARGA
jgi:thiol-disulfide isomerase/thioredoxin